MKTSETYPPGKLFKEESAKAQPVTCLGQTFPNDAARRAHFTELLRQKLQDPEFRKIEGFPIGSDEDILNLSDPPYYCACPNPWIADFIAEWEAEKPEQPEGGHYHREPFAADVSEGKNDPIYNAHSYHTKVPHKAIMRYILHYTEPGDIVFDGFCGTGMTGVAAQLCGDRQAVQALGYRVEADGTILREETDDNGKPAWRAFSRLGARRAVLNDLSPAATFIAYNYNTPVDVAAFEREARRILAEVERECGWMYETKHIDGRIGRIDYTVWTEVFTCPTCTGEILFLNEALDLNTKQVRDFFPCPHCQTVLNKKILERIEQTKFDRIINKFVKYTRREPALIVYHFGKKQFEKVPDQFDFDILKKIENKDIIDYFPSDRMMHAPDDVVVWGDKWRSGTASFSHIHHLYIPRALHVLASIWPKIDHIPGFRTKSFVKFCYEQSITGLSLLNRYGPTHFSQVNRNMTGVYYIASQHSECSPWYNLSGKIKRLAKIYSDNSLNTQHITLTQDSSNTKLNNNSIDYIFIDPPFGDNIAYGELNFIIESFHRIFTNMNNEAIVSKYQSKGFDEYKNIMTSCFMEFYRILKPGRWITVEFSNTKASIWNCIQSALSSSGFIIANVSALDKKQGGFNAVNNPTSVKQDLVITAYKPNGGFEERFAIEAESETGVWDFVRTHLGYLPVVKQQNGRPAHIPERDPRILFDRMVAYYVRKVRHVPVSTSQEFQQGLRQRFAERDGMFFLPEQAAEYDKKKMIAGEIGQMSLFVSDEVSALQWLRQELKDKPQRFSDINPKFMPLLSTWGKNEALLDLRELLAQNFLCYDGKGPVPEQIHAYLSTNWKELRNLPKDDPALVDKARDRWYVPDPNKAGDLEKLRERALLREFEEYKKRTKKFKSTDRVRIEAVRAGFKRAWQERDYAAILAVGKIIPSAVLEEDPMVQMWHDQAVTRMGGE